MIDKVMRELIVVEAGCAFEGIASDYMECEDANAEDAVEPTVWHMAQERSYGKTTPLEYQEIQKMAEHYDHPDRQEFLKIVAEAVKRYF